MRITQEADYALRVVLYLTKLGYGNRADASKISDSEKIPLRFLLKLLRKLIASEIIISYRGKNGGYSLKKLPKNISVKDVIESIDGSISLNRCVFDPEYCSANRSKTCELHLVLEKVNNELKERLGNINFEDIKNGIC
ncbi:Rrf2 family transcriptional regulator [Clostridium fermenticellae]|uniref:Rrf2 family transcriptional regulator n=1 Tax=Clostridium fermenticellae TaxID=2068654 RepID=A0A386H5L2_9CLOT|nr:Rrf2 family transcriptional regulator [Clostridium fermenticellae]AYD40894.1 Rrf2 family transcriptional regulator [Clostridium fermenticellae]